MTTKPFRYIIETQDLLGTWARYRSFATRLEAEEAIDDELIPYPPHVISVRICKEYKEVVKTSGDYELKGLHL